MIARLPDVVDPPMRGANPSAHQAAFSSPSEAEWQEPDAAISLAEYEAWLLPAEPRTTAEKLMQGLSEVAGWLALTASLAGLYLLFG